jgi:hypothetical protein
VIKSESWAFVQHAVVVLRNVSVFRSQFPLSHSVVVTESNVEKVFGPDEPVPASLAGQLEEIRAAQARQPSTAEVAEEPPASGRAQSDEVQPASGSSYQQQQQQQLPTSLPQPSQQGNPVPPPPRRSAPVFVADDDDGGGGLGDEQEGDLRWQPRRLLGDASTAQDHASTAQDHASTAQDRAIDLTLSDLPPHVLALLDGNRKPEAAGSNPASAPRPAPAPAPIPAAPAPKPDAASAVIVVRDEHDESWLLDD